MLLWTSPRVDNMPKKNSDVSIQKSKNNELETVLENKRSVKQQTWINFPPYPSFFFLCRAGKETVKFVENKLILK